jgi:hypothetical protein
MLDLQKNRIYDPDLPPDKKKVAKNKVDSSESDLSDITDEEQDAFSKGDQTKFQLNFNDYLERSI